MIMKVWAITLLLLFLVCLTVPFVTADNPIEFKDKKPVRTPAAIDFKRDALAPVKQIIGLKVDPVEITIDGKWVATIPEDSPLFNMPVTEECLKQWPYGTLQWAKCEGGI
jgi:hypothetical protein